MQLKTTTDYAVRAVVCLAAHGAPMSSLDIAEKMGIPAKYVINIMVVLRGADIVASIKGAEGGYYLTREPGELTLWDVIEAMECSMSLNRCMEEDAFCSHHRVGACPTREVYLRAQRALEKCLRVPIASILETREDAPEGRA